jgi:amino acid transporter
MRSAFIQKYTLQLGLQSVPTHLSLLTTLHTHLTSLGPAFLSIMAIEDDEKNDQHGTDIASTVSADIVPIDMSEHGTMKRALKPRHSQMIALGGCVGAFSTKQDTNQFLIHIPLGTGLFVGTGATLALGGPAFLLTAFIVLIFLVYIIVTAIVEMVAYLPVGGASLPYYGTRYVSKSLGFAMGWLYVYSLGILVPYEITAGALVIDYWDR